MWLGAAVALTRGLIPATIATLKDEWPRPRFSSYHEFLGQTLGIVGFGSIGRVVAKKAHAFRLQCVAYDPMLSVDAVELDGFSVPLITLNALLSSSDTVSLHLPFLPETKNLFNASTLDQMTEGACLVNRGRGGIVDELALAEHLRSGRIGGAAIDVFLAEPAKDLNHFVGIENLILTPHTAGVTHESNERVSQMIADNPNVAGVVVIGIEPQWRKIVVDGIKTAGKPVEGFWIEGNGDTATVASASKAAYSMM